MATPWLDRLSSKRLFATAFGLKFLSALLAWQLHSPWTLGLAVPLSVMLAYIGVGLARTHQDVSEEKFADSCYYLGFLFTITSIVFALMDLPDIGTRLPDIAVRFGAALLSTLLGLAVRVYLVSFRPEAADAAANAETAVLHAAERLKEQLALSADRLASFSAGVDVAARGTLERVNLQLEKLMDDQATRLSAYCATLIQRDTERSDAQLGMLKDTSAAFVASMAQATASLDASVAAMHSRLSLFALATSDYMDTARLPDTLFRDQLKAPLANLELATQQVVHRTAFVAGQMGRAGDAMASAVERVEGQAHTMADVLASMRDFSAQVALLAGQVERIASVAAAVPPARPPVP